MVAGPEPLTSSTQYGLLMICWPSSYLQPLEASPYLGRSQAKDTHLIPIPKLLPGGPVSCLVEGHLPYFAFCPDRTDVG